MTLVQAGNTRWQHVKTGGIYEIIAFGRCEATLDEKVVYKSTSGDVWIRDHEEFFDGRFVEADIFDVLMADDAPTED